MEKFDKFKELMKDKEFVDGLAGKETEEEAKAFLAENGVVCSDEEVAELGKIIAFLLKAPKESDGELTEEQLQAIAGGTDITNPAEVLNEFHGTIDTINHLPDNAWNWALKYTSIVLSWF